MDAYTAVIEQGIARQKLISQELELAREYADSKRVENEFVKEQFDKLLGSEAFSNTSAEVKQMIKDTMRKVRIYE